MIVVGHQPQYLPYIGFFNKAAKAETFVFVDNIQFARKSWQQRTLIKGVNNEPLCLTIPVSKKGKYHQLINEVEILDDGWRRKHWKSIQFSYMKTPYFDLYKNDLEAFYNREWRLLSEFTISLTQYLFDAIGFKFAYSHIGSDLGIAGEKTDLLIDICRKTNCDTYLSGNGAKAYVEEQKMVVAGYKHLFNDYQSIRYSQKGENFLEGMAIIDAMFMYGPKTLSLIRGDK